MAGGKRLIWSKSSKRYKANIKRQKKILKTLNSRAKGANGEREFAKKIEEYLGIKLVRRLDQTRGGGFDLEVDDGQEGPIANELRGMALECKRYGTVRPSNILTWWEQTLRQAKNAGLVPVLAYRANYWDWKVIVPLNYVRSDIPFWESIELTAEFPIQAFATLVRESSLDKSA
jgi:Holliday junction resolvase